MSKFAVGDKVRFVEPKEYCTYVGASDNWPKVCDTGVVTGHIEQYTIVRLDNATRPDNGVGDNGWRFIDEWLERALRFKVGDRVKAKNGVTLYPLAEFAGKTGVVSEVRSPIDNDDYYVVTFDDGTHDACYERNLEPAPVVAPAKKLRFNVGDKVTVTNDSVNRANNGRSGVITDKAPERNGSYDYGVNLDGSGYTPCDDDELSPFTPALRIGDKVRVKNVDYYSAEASEGAVGVVVTLDSEEIAGRPVGVNITKYSPRSRAIGNPNTFEYDYRPEDLEVIASTPATPQTTVAEAPAFAKGDKVRLLPSGVEYIRSLYANAPDTLTGVISYKETGGNRYYSVLLDDKRYRNRPEFSLLPEQMEKVVETPAIAEPKFAVNDKVRLTCVCHNGVTGVVTRVDGKYADVRIDDNGDVLTCRFDELEIVKRQPKVGDRVKVRRSYMVAKECVAKVFAADEARLNAKVGELCVEYDYGGWDRLTSVEILGYLDEPAPVTPAVEEAKPTILAVGTKVRIKASVTDDDLRKIAYPLDKREGEFSVVTLESLWRPGEWTKLSNGWYVRPAMLEVVPDAAKRKFAVGDKVRVTKDTRFCGFYSEGAEGVVESISDKRCDTPYTVRLTKGSSNGNAESAIGDRVYYGDNELALVAPSQDKPVVRTIARSNLRFTRKGDRIIVEANGKRVATVSVEELREMTDEMTKEAE